MTGVMRETYTIRRLGEIGVYEQIHESALSMRAEQCAIADSL